MVDVRPYFRLGWGGTEGRKALLPGPTNALGDHFLLPIVKSVLHIQITAQR